MKRPVKRLFGTMRGRFFLVISITIVGCLTIMELSSFSTIRKVVERRGYAEMALATQSITLTMENEYYDLLQISQQMSPTGSVGQQFRRYLSAPNYYAKYEAADAMRSAFTVLMFSAGGEFATYYNPVTGENYLNGLSDAKHDFSLVNGLRALRKTDSMDYHAIHCSQYRFSDSATISVSRTCRFLPKKDITIYVEAKSAAPAFLNELRLKNRLGYVLLQLSQDGVVCYSTDNSIPLGTPFTQIATSHEQFGRWKDYVWNRSDLNFGFSNVLLLPISQFYSNLSFWLRDLILALVAAMVLISVSVFLLYQLILKKNQCLQVEIDRVGRGNLEHVAQKTGLAEYDRLLERMDEMVDRIRQLVQDVGEQERKRGDVERELLYYQINPHFVLNSLNSAYWLARMNNAAAVEQYLSRLTSILRHSLGKDREPQVLRKEIEMLRIYLELEQQRYDFHFLLAVEEGPYLDTPAPRLLIQPIAENAISHGLDVDGHLDIRVQMRNDKIEITITDDGAGIDAETIRRIYENLDQPSDHSGIGLRYVCTVMNACYGSSASMQITSQPGRGTTVVLCLPLTGTAEGITT